MMSGAVERVVMESVLPESDSLPESDGVFEDIDRSPLVTLLHQVADVSLVIDADGRIVDIDVSGEDLENDFDAGWVGRNWIDTVADDSRSRIEELLTQTRAGGETNWQDIIHRQPDGSELPISYRAVAAGKDDRVIAVGRDLRAVASLRQQLVNAQIALERDYWRLRQVETRYRLVFQMVDEAVLVVDEQTDKILEANQAASRILGMKDGSIVGKSFLALFDEGGADSVRALLSELRVVGRGEADAITGSDGKRQFSISANLLKQDAESRILARLSEPRSELGVSEGAGEAALRMDEILRGAPDAVLVTGSGGRVLAANQRFIDLAELANEEQARGQSVDRWFGRSAVDLNVLLSHLRRGEPVRLFATTLKGEYGTATEVEISASVFSGQQETCFVFFVRDVARRLSADDPATAQLPRSVAQITQQVGRVPLKALVRQSTDVVEKLCIEAALKLTGDNRASAAELLGLSRQSLYSKLRRHNLGDIGPDDAS